MCPSSFVFTYTINDCMVQPGDTPSSWMAWHLETAKEEDSQRGGARGVGGEGICPWGAGLFSRNSGEDSLFCKLSFCDLLYFVFLFCIDFHFLVRKKVKTSKTSQSLWACDQGRMAETCYAWRINFENKLPIQRSEEINKPSWLSVWPSRSTD